MIIEYDGTDFNGWQRQAAGRTVQGEIEAAVSRMTQRRVTVHGAGRTDAGVHAFGQCAHLACETRLTTSELLSGINALTPRDIAVLSVTSVADHFHARFRAKGKRYRYRIVNRPIPSAVERRFAWNITAPLNRDAMRKATESILGTRDFQAFEGAGSPRDTTVRTIGRAEWIEGEADLLLFEVEADGFLRYMVRNIVGTLILVGRGKIPPGDVSHILQGKDRGRAGPTAPPHGLFLMEVLY